MANPIWKDFYVNLGTADSVQFRIKCYGELVYSGKSWKRPGASSNEIRINDICADYLESHLALKSESFSEIESPVFVIETLNGEEWEEINEIQFYLDWSYDYAFSPEVMGLSHPINKRISPYQWMVFTAYQATSIRMDVYYENGTSSFAIVPIEISPSFNIDFNSDFAKVAKSRTGTAVFRLAEYVNITSPIKSVTIGGHEYEIVNNCNRYALFYANAYGGWDSFLIEGNYSEADNLIRHIRETEYDNRNIQNRGKHNYINEISKTISLHTSWLTDDESSRMHHLLNSTEVYLQDIDAGVMIPVILNNSTTEYKTYKTNGGKLVNYTIEVTIAQDRVRR